MLAPDTYLTKKKRKKKRSFIYQSAVTQWTQFQQILGELLQPISKFLSNLKEGQFTNACWNPLYYMFTVSLNLDYTLKLIEGIWWCYKNVETDKNWLPSWFYSFYQIWIISVLVVVTISEAIYFTLLSCKCPFLSTFLKYVMG